MSKVAELVAAAKTLNIMELKELRTELQRLEKRRPDKCFNLNGFSIGLTRLDNEEYIKLFRRSIAIQGDTMFLINLLDPIFPRIKKEQKRQRLNLAEFRFVMEYLYGESSPYFDDYKCSFSFPFALDVIKGDNMYPYLLDVRDYRGWFEFSLRKCVDRKEQADDIIHPPCEAEFSREEINTFIAYFCGYLEGRYEVLMASNTRPTPFVYRIDSNHVIYGYCDERFFEKHYDQSQEFDEACSRYSNEILETREKLA